MLVIVTITHTDTPQTPFPSNHSGLRTWLLKPTPPSKLQQSRDLNPRISNCLPQSREMQISRDQGYVSGICVKCWWSRHGHG